MKLLLDTHVLLWWLDDPSKIAEATRSEIANQDNAVYVSATSIQEIVIKQGRGRLRCPEPLLPLLEENRFSHLPLTLAHALAMRELPSKPKHKDPFDRQLVAQAASENMTLVTRDRALTDYSVPFLIA